MYDVAIIGGGLSGSSLALLLSKVNINVVILEAGNTPGFHLPETGIFENIETLKMFSLSDEELNIVLNREMKVCFRSGDGSEEIGISHIFNMNVNQPHGSKLSSVDRVKFDDLLLKKAILHGACYKDGANVQYVNVSQELPSIVYRELGECKTLSARLVIDASGKSAILANQLKLKEEIKYLNKNTLIFTHFEDSEFMPSLHDQTVYVTEINGGYIFVIPINMNRVSVGVVINDGSIINKNELEKIFMSCVKQSSWLYEGIKNSSRKLPFLMGKNEAFTCSSYGNRNYLIIGEATGFKDPHYCNGIETSLKMTVCASASIINFLTSADKFSNVFQKYNGEIQDLICTSKDAVVDWLNQNTLKIKLDTASDPHIPYSISHFLASLSLCREAKVIIEESV